jgi:hypothetical protein
VKLGIGIFIGALAGLALGWLARPIFEYGKAVAPPVAVEKPEPEKPDRAIHLDKTRQEFAGIRIESPQAIRIAPEVKGYGRILDPAPFITLNLNEQTAEATLKSSKLEYERVHSLYAQNQNASARALEIAEATMKRDEALLAEARARLSIAFGPALGQEKTPPEILKGLSNWSCSLARADLPGEYLKETPIAARIAPLADETRLFEAEVIGPAPAVEGQAQGQGFLLLLKTNSLPPATAIAAFFSLPGGELSGYKIPTTAVVQNGAVPEIFLAKGAETFEAFPVRIERSIPGGFLVTSGFSGKERIVTEGAQTLLSEANKRLLEE